MISALRSQYNQKGLLRLAVPGTETKQEVVYTLGAIAAVAAFWTLADVKVLGSEEVVEFVPEDGAEPGLLSAVGAYLGLGKVGNGPAGGYGAYVAKVSSQPLLWRFGKKFLYVWAAYVAITALTLGVDGSMAKAVGASEFGAAKGMAYKPYTYKPYSSSYEPSYTSYYGGLDSGAAASSYACSYKMKE